MQTKVSEGFTVIRLESFADEDKGEEWLKQKAREYPKEDFDREFLLKPVGQQDSYPVFPDYNRERHEDSKLIYNRILQLIYRGWDFGKVHPCVEFLQPDGQRINAIYEIYGNNVYLDDFASRVLADSGLYFPGAIFVDWGDPSCVNERDDGRSSLMVLKDKGIRLRYKREDVETGVHSISKNLTQWTGGRPNLQLNPDKCPMLRDAFRGGYKRNPRGELIKDGKYDHPMDGCRYAHQGIMHNIQAQFVRSKPKRNRPTDRPLSDSEQFSKYRRI